MAHKNRFNGEPGRGVLMTNRKKRGPTSPDYSGQLVLDRDHKKGDRLELFAWDKKTVYGRLISIIINRVRKGYDVTNERPYQGRLSPDETLL